MIVPLNFNTLSRADQADLLLAEGVYLNTRREAGKVIDQYALHNFYVDVHYIHTTNDVLAVQSFYPRQQQPPIYQMHLPRLRIRQGA